MLGKLARYLKSDDGGIATYVAQAVMVLAVLSIAFLIIAASTNLGKFLTDRIYAFMEVAMN